jgi:hypothetical protein
VVRAGLESDLPRLLALSTRLRDESLTMRGVSIDTPKLTKVFRRAFDPNDPRVCIFLHEHDGEIRGGMLGYIAEYYFSRELFATDLFLYVDTNLRRGLLSGVIARRLFQAYRDWAFAGGVREVRICVSTGIAIDGAHRFFTSMDMLHIGGHYSQPRATEPG